MFRLALLFSSFFICSVLASEEKNAVQLVLQQKLLSFLRRECPEKIHKLDQLKSQWKSIQQDLARNRIRDLSRFVSQVDEETVRRYGVWACTSGARIRRSLPPLHTIPLNDGTANNFVDSSDEGEDDLAFESEQMENNSRLPNLSYTSKPLLGAFVCGLVIGALASLVFSNRSTVLNPANTRTLRRPEL